MSSKIFIREKTDYMHIKLIKSESYSWLALQDFTIKYGIPHTIKIDNTRIENGNK